MSRGGFRTVAALGALVVLWGTCGCTLTVAHPQPSTVAPEPPPFSPQPGVEHSVGDFSLAWGTGEGKPSELIDGYLLTNEIMGVWKERGYIHDERFVEAESYSGTADYNLVLTGGQRNSASFFMELINALSLTLWPYKVTNQYSLQYDLQDLRSGRNYRASVVDEDTTAVGTMLLPVVFWAQRGHRVTVQRMADELYRQFRDQGAFELPSALSAAAP